MTAGDLAGDLPSIVLRSVIFNQHIIFMKNTFVLFLSAFSISLFAQQANFTDEYRGEVLREAQIMPRFPGCEEQNLGADEVQMCAIKKLLQFIEENKQHPELAR